MAGLGPRVLQVLEFANARAPELQALHELSQHEPFTHDAEKKVETQKNQRRRRANAFKSHKMPQRLRSTLKTSTSSRCRKHSRRPHTLLQKRSCLSEESETGRPRWLPSHLYHAKRMAMDARYGYILAVHRADKSVSAALQAVRNKAVLHDVSYYGVIELYGVPSALLTVLQLISDPNGSDFHGLRFLAGDEEGHSMLHHMGRFPQGAIAPVTFMWRPLKKDYSCGRFVLHQDWQSAKRQLWLWVHPAAYMEAATAIASACQEVCSNDEDGVEMLDRRGQLCRLKLRGRLANELVASIASTAGDKISIVDKVDGVSNQDAQDGTVSDHEDGFDAKETVAQCCSGNRRKLLRALSKKKTKKQDDEQKCTVCAIAVEDPRVARWNTSASCYRLTGAETGLSLLNEPPAYAVPDLGKDVIPSPLSGASLSSLGKNAEEPESEVIMNELQALLSWTTCSSNLTRVTESGSLRHLSAVDSDKQRKPDDGGDASEMDEGPTPNSLLWSSSMRLKLESNFRKDHKLNETIFRHRKGNKLGHTSDAVHVQSQALNLLLVKKREPFPHTSGWDIICLPSSVPSILKTLVFGGAMVVGLEEDAALSTVLHQPSFPCDYPDTQAGQLYWEARVRDLETEQAKKPKAKRFSNGKHSAKPSFKPRWELLFDEHKRDGDAKGNATAEVNDRMPVPTSGVNAIVPVAMPTLVRVVVIVPRRGNIDVNAMLFAPRAGDVDRFENDINWKGTDTGVSENKTWDKSAERDERSLIGFVTSAIYDRPKGAFRAVGFVACEPLQQLFLTNKDQRYRKQDHCALAMLRSPRGRMVRPVLVQVGA